MGTVLLIIYAFIFTFILYKQGLKLDGVKKQTLPILFIFKFCIGLFFLYVYTYHYGGGELSADAGAFFSESKTLFEVFSKSPTAYFKFIFGIDNSPEFVDQYLATTNHWNASTKPLLNDSQNVMRINSLFYFLSSGEVLIHILFSCFLSFVGVFELFKWIKAHSKLKTNILLILLILTPSTLFWSSSFLKEPFLIFGFGFFLRGLLDYNLSTKKRLPRIILGLIFLVGFKPYVLLCLLPALLFYIVYFKFLTRKLFLSIILTGAVCISPFLIPTSKSKIVDTISRQQTDFINVGLGGLHLFRNDTIYYFEGVERGKMRVEGNMIFLLEETEGSIVVDKKNYGLETVKIRAYEKPWHILYQSDGSASQFKITRINASLWNMVKIIPEVFLNTLMRPFPGDKGTWLIYLAMLENFGIIILLLFVIFFLKRKINSEELGIIITLLLFTLILYLIIGYTTPVSGAIVRYKIPGVISTVMILAILIDPKKIKKT